MRRVSMQVGWMLLDVAREIGRRTTSACNDGDSHLCHTISNTPVDHLRIIMLADTSSRACCTMSQAEVSDDQNEAAESMAEMGQPSRHGEAVLSHASDDISDGCESAHKCASLSSPPSLYVVTHSHSHSPLSPSHLRHLSSATDSTVPNTFSSRLSDRSDVAAKQR